MLKKPRPPRIESPGDEGIEDETAHLWAISYADFLMVLLSFFILFFSVDQKKKDSIISKIVMEQFSEENKGGSGSGEGSAGKGKFQSTSGVGVGNNAKGKEKLSDIKDLKDSVFKKMKSDFSLSVTENDKSLVISFPNDIYNSGQVDLSVKKKEQVSLILEKLRPFINDIEITFVGHTDDVRVKDESRIKTGNILSNNYDLSVLRASKVLSYALNKKFPAEHLSARGAGAQGRNTRSLSLLIRAYSDSGI